MPTHVLLLERPGPGALSATEVQTFVGADVVVATATSRAEFVLAAAARPWDVVVAAVDLPGFPGAQVWTWLRSAGYSTPLVLVCDDADLADGIALVRLGASDVVLRRDRWRLGISLSRALVESAVRQPAPRVAEGDGWLRGLLDQLAYGIVVVDALGRVVWMSAPAQRLYGLEDTPTRGLDARMVLPAGWRELAGGAPHAGTARRADGAETPVEIRLRKAESGPEPVYVVSVRDLSERRALERELQQAQRMEAVANLAAGVGHEFNNILTGILTFASLLRRDLGPEHPSTPDVLEIEASGERAAALVRQLLLMARRQPVTLKRVDLNRLVRDTAAFLERVTGPQPITFLVASGEGVPSVLADPSQVEQVLTNLALNARDAMPEGGTLRLTTGTRLEPAARAGLMPIAAGRYVTLEVADTGTGMDADTLQRIFDPFFTTKPSGQGSGLGLPVVHGILRQHGGFIEVDSAPGQGTRVVVAFPADPAGVPAAPAESQSEVNRGHETILLAEDDETVRAVVERILENHGYHVVTARDGEDALGRFRDAPARFDAAVVDVLMPRMGGVDLYHAMERIRADLPVLWVSGYSGGNQIVLNEHTDFLAKPFNPTDLARRLRALLDRPGLGR